jgi:hypothetical protein
MRAPSEHTRHPQYRFIGSKRALYALAVAGAVPASAVAEIALRVVCAAVANPFRGIPVPQWPHAPAYVRIYALPHTKKAN